MNQRNTLFFLVMFDCKKEIINPELNNPHTFNPFVIENTVDSYQKSFLLASARLKQCVCYFIVYNKSHLPLFQTFKHMILSNTCS